MITIDSTCLWATPTIYKRRDQVLTIATTRRVVRVRSLPPVRIRRSARTSSLLSSPVVWSESPEHRPEAADVCRLRFTGVSTTVSAETVGQVWLDIARLILSKGRPGRWSGAPLREVLQVTLDVARPASEDPLIARYANPERLARKHANFADPARIAELDQADSYATRLYNYAHSGRDQIAWVVSRLRDDRWVRDATITTLQPLSDTSYVPCVSLLDFWLEADAVQLGVYAHGIDFGTKGYANLVELAALQHHVAREVGCAVGRLTMTVKSAHVYDTELDLVHRILASRGRNDAAKATP